MDKKKIIRYAEIIGLCLAVVILIWMFVLSPIITFKNNEKTMLKAAKRYYEINSNELPTGNRIKTLKLKTLYYKAFIKEDLTTSGKKNCSVNNSWVKTRKENGQYKYYVYLECGYLKSKVDHDGPKVTLNGKDEITINRGEKYKELGVKSVVDKTDGNLNTNKVEIDSSKVKTNKIGTYKVTYTVSDSFNNETVKTRTVKVVANLNNIIEKDTNKQGIYKGSVINNYIEFSGMLYRIIGVDSDNNVKIVADKDVSYVNYKSLDKWLDYYYDHLSTKSKEYIVKSKYCNELITDDKLDTKKCNSYTDSKNLYILSVQDYNNSKDENNNTYLYPSIISLTANKKSSKEIYTTRDYFTGSDSTYMSFDINYNFGVRPVLTLKKNIYLKSGDGTPSSPYVFEKYETANAGDKLNTRYSGEYISYSGYTWRIIEKDDDDTTKVILSSSLPVTTSYETTDKSKIYNPTQKGNVGYFINNKITEYVKTNYFIKKKITVPIYNNLSSYKGEKSTKTYKVKLSAPNMYDLYTASDYSSSYWLINSSKKEKVKNIVSDNGTIYYEPKEDDFEAGIKLVGYIDKNCTIESGSGTLEDPYVIVK